MKILILAGGGGTRLWPLSRSDSPKQFQPLLNNKSLLQETADRAKKIANWSDIYVIAPKKYKQQVQEHLKEIPVQNIILEPSAMNTAPAIGLAAMHLAKKDPKEVIAVLPSDHFIKDEEQFIQILKRAENIAAKGTHLVTLGIMPTHPETGYGYIKAEKMFEKGSFLVERFLEKPDKKTAQKFVNSGEHFWNSGMFIWRADTILKAFQNLMPGTYKALEETLVALESGDDEKAVIAFEKTEKTSIDYGIMEGSKNILVIPASFGWSDLGSFITLKKILKTDKNGNTLEDKLVTIDSNNCFVKNQTKKVISLIGLDHIGVIETEDVLLVCDLRESGKIKDLLEEMKGNEDFKKLL